MAAYKYFTADVFTNTRFGGNQLAVLPDARGLTTEQMQAIAKEFNYPESTFVLPPDDPKHTRRVRIFTPASEMPFAGHPTVGTAHVLASIGEVALTGDDTRIVFEEIVGPVPVRITSRDGKPTFCQLSVAKLPEPYPPIPPREVLAPMLSLEVEDLLDGRYHPQAYTVGPSFAFIPLRSRDAVRRAKLRTDLWQAALALTPHHMVFVFAMDAEATDHHVRARMFAPGESLPEDPATGSACAALGGYLAARDDRQDGTLRWVVEQGYEMGRPSVLHLEVDKSAGATTAVRVGGGSVMVCEGMITV